MAHEFARDQRSQFNSDILHNLFFAMEVLKKCLLYVKAIFNRISEVLISNADLREFKGQSLEQKIPEDVFPLKVSSVYLFYVKKIFLTA